MECESKIGRESAPLHPFDVGLILSYKCQSACKHCAFNCGPGWDEWMTLDTVREALAAAVACPSVRQVHFTGGEPFLNFPLLLSAVQFASELNIPQYVETNAAWCISRDLVTDRFTALEDAGLNVIAISCSPFHAESIPLTRTLLAIDCALDIFGPNRVMVDNPEMIDQIMRFGTRTPTPLYRYREAFGAEPAGLMFWEGYHLKAGGRAGYLLGEMTERFPAETFQQESCYGEIVGGDQANFDLYGNYIPSFCGGISLGSWRQLTDLAFNFDTIGATWLIRSLLFRGPYGLFEIVEKDYDYTQLSSGYAGKCHLCVDVRRHLVRSEEFKELAPLGFYQNF